VGRGKIANENPHTGVVGKNSLKLPVVKLDFEAGLAL
jgi:hypothetical protein